MANNTKERILAAALEMFSQNGYAGTNIRELMSAALPWISMGLLLAIFFAKAAHGKQEKEKKEDHSSEGMALGMCFGVALSTALHINVGLGMMAGMVLGLLVGSEIKKKSDNDEGGKTE